MKAKKKKRFALKIALNLTVAAGQGGAKSAVPTILKESYQAALAVLNEIEGDDKETHPNKEEMK